MSLLDDNILEETTFKLPDINEYENEWNNKINYNIPNEVIKYWSGFSYKYIQGNIGIKLTCDYSSLYQVFFNYYRISYYCPDDKLNGPWHYSWNDDIINDCKDLSSFDLMKEDAHKVFIKECLKYIKFKAENH